MTAIRDLSLDALAAIINGKPAPLVQGGDWIEAELLAAGIDPATADPDRVWLLSHKMQKTGLGLCKARTRKGTLCLCLGDGMGGRCKLHGGCSTGARTPEGRARALANLLRGRRISPQIRARIDMGCEEKATESRATGEQGDRPHPPEKSA